jgi:predicted AAA+ superfamily ATPase
MIPRIAEKTLHRYAKGFPVIYITGPRQSGKTTLARLAFPKKRYFSLEDPDTLLLVRSDPRGFLDQWPDGLILDEAQYLPELFKYVKAMVDNDPKPGRYIITGSQQFNLMEKITESLAGRASFLTLLPFSLAELVSAPELVSAAKAGSPLCAENPWELMIKGFYPPLYDRDLNPRDFYAAYITSYVERDLRQLVNVKELNTFQSFIKFCAARTGGVLNLSSLALDCGITHNTAKAWISVLTISGIVYLLRPYYKNFGKRLVKSPKLYFVDPGLACRLLGIQTAEQLFLSPLRGGLFEGFIISELIKNRLNRGENPELWFWRDNNGMEIDCLIAEAEKLAAMEIKSGKTFNDEMTSCLERWSKIYTEGGDRFLVYTGLQKSAYKGIKLLPWKDIVNI